MGGLAGCKRVGGLATWTDPHVPRCPTAPNPHGRCPIAAVANPCARAGAVHPGSVAAIRDLCTYAVDRLQAKIDPAGHTGVNVLAAVTQGTEFGSYLCRNGLDLDRAAHPERCAPGAPIYNQTWGLRWPMSVTMWRFNGSNADEVTSTMKAWRTGCVA